MVDEFKGEYWNKSQVAKGKELAKSQGYNKFKVKKGSYLGSYTLTGKKGWQNESERHRMARYGIKTGRKNLVGIARKRGYTGMTAYDAKEQGYLKESDLKPKSNLRSLNKLLKDSGIENEEVTKFKGKYHLLHILKNGVPVPLFISEDAEEVKEYISR